MQKNISKNFSETSFKVFGIQLNLHNGFFTIFSSPDGKQYHPKRRHLLKSYPRWGSQLYNPWVWSDQRNLPYTKSYITWQCWQILNQWNLFYQSFLLSSEFNNNKFVMNYSLWTRTEGNQYWGLLKTVFKLIVHDYLLPLNKNVRKVRGLVLVLLVGLWTADSGI